MTIIPTVDAARGHWPYILRMLGLPAEALRPKKKGPCPLCGGTDRYRFTNKDDNGWYYCNQCGPGSGIVLVRKFLKLDYAAACREIDKILANYNNAPDARQPVQSDIQKLVAIEQLLDAATDPSIVAQWYAARGLTVSTSVLRGHPACPLYDEASEKFIGWFPAVVAPIHDAQGHLVSAQRLYLHEQSVKKVMPPAGTINGAAIHLFDIDHDLGVAEGIATALAATELFSVRTWAVLHADNMKRFEPPAGVKRLFVFGDNDASFTGQAAAYELARLAHRKGLDVTVNIPPDTDSDWNDMLA